MFNKFYTLSLVFLLMVPLGTMFHECGHYLSAKFYGHQPVMHYASVSLQDVNKIKLLTDSLIHSVNMSSEDKKDLYSEVLKLRKESFFITLSGPLFNMGMGSICFLILLLFGSNIHFHRYKWWFIFGSFLWSRQIINFCYGILLFLKNGNWGQSGDETNLSNYLQYPAFTFDLMTAALASIILLVVFINYMNKEERIAFVLAGTIAGSLSALLWFKVIGPLLLP
ncbi:MAG TPA: hypothetical protein VGF79_11930 [Bacteroidia bacterium]